MTNMYELLNKLATKLSSLEDNDGEVILKDEEFDIDGTLFFVSGSINYTISYSHGDYYTPEYSSRDFYYAELDIKYYDEESETDIVLNDSEIKHVIKNI